jgi:hypothetical protein
METAVTRKAIGPKRRHAAVLGCCVLVLTAIGMQFAVSPSGAADSRPPISADFQPNEAQVSAEADLIDPEYDQETAQFTWVDSLGNLWIGVLDSAGMFQPPSGKAILVDPRAMKMIDLRVTANGPEWIQTNQGPKIVYTKFLAGRPHTPQNARLALAKPLGDGEWADDSMTRHYSLLELAEPLGEGDWSFEFLNPEKRRMAPYGSKDVGDPAPRISYLGPDRRHYWAEVDHPDTEELIPLIASSSFGVRFVANSRAVVFTAQSPVDQTLQVFKYDIDTKVVEQLTFDNVGQKSTSSVWMWPAPEYDNDYVFFVLVDYGASNALDIYRRMQDGGDSTAVWTKINSIVAPSSQIGSPEPFTFDGHSYVFMQLTVNQDEYPTSIWLAGIDPANPFFRKLSDDSQFRWRTDPEVFVTDEGPYIYYNRRDPADPNCNDAKCTEGIFRTYTGLSMSSE